MPEPEPFTIALDGPAASGKSSVGLGVARQLGYRFFDTGLLYRALTWLALETATEVTDGGALARLIDRLEVEVEVDAVGRVFRKREDITPLLQTPEVDASVSAASAHASVRSALVPFQRALVRAPGVVMAGRDIGTVILPDARLKIWLIASAAERARRRAAQTGEAYAAVLDGMQRRDRLDGSRAVAPMAVAADAVEVDTDGLGLDQVIARIVELARARGARTAVSEHA